MRRVVRGVSGMLLLGGGDGLGSLRGGGVVG